MRGSMRGVCGVVTVLCGLLLGCKSPVPAQRAVSPPAATSPASKPDQGSLDEYWQNALEEVYKSPGELQAQHEAEARRGIHLNKLLRGNQAKRQIALTFDDGPHPDFTPGILSALSAENVKATFFLVGEKAEQYPDLVKAEVAAGHNVGNHTYHHVNLTKIPNRLVATEIKACGDVIAGITGTAPHLFRPPGGDYDVQVAEVATQLGYTMVLWTDDPGDYASPPRGVLEGRILEHASNGGIILIHDGVKETIQLLPQMIKSLKARGFEFVTVDEMLGQR